MSTTIKTGWLNDKDGNKFAPKTLTSQVQTSDGILIEDKIQADLDAAKAEILENVSIPVDNALSSTSENPVQNKVLDAEFNAINTAMDEIEQSVDGKADAEHSHIISDVTDLQSNLDTINDTLIQKSQVQVVTESGSELLSTLKIHKLTQEEYNEAVVNGTLEDNALYLTPEEEIDLSGYATIEQLGSKADAEHSHDDLYYTESEVDTLLSSKSDSTHNHDSTYDAKGSADSALASAKEYTDSAVSVLANASHTHDDLYYTESEINTKIDEINTSISTSTTEAKSYADTGDATTLESSKTYTDNAVAQKTQVQIITWEADD